MVANKRQKVESADALDDDLEYEIGSDSAGEAEQINDDEVDSQSESDGSEGIKKDEEISSKVLQATAKKEISADEKRERRKLRKESTKKRKAEELLDGEGDGDGMGTVLSVDQQSDTFARLVKDSLAASNLSSIELADRTLATASFIDTTAFRDPRTLDALVPFMRRFSGRQQLEVANKDVGRPHTLLLAPSAIRVADLCRALAALKTKQASVAKLFGKEKLETQATWLQKSRVNVAVGLPARTLALIDRAAVKVDRVEQVYVDASYKDAKKRGMLSIKEVSRDLIKLLGQEVLAERIKKGECRIVLF